MSLEIFIQLKQENIESLFHRVIVCEDLNFFWDEPELKTLVRMWDVGVSVAEIAQHFKRDPDEVRIALIHLAREKKIGSRKGGLEGDGDLLGKS